MSNMPTLRDIINGAAVDATDVEWNFNTIQTHVNQELIARDGTVAMDAGLNLVAGPPSAAAHATRKDYVDNLVANLSVPIGSIVMYGGLVVPDASWAFCVGQNVSKATYAKLFERFGTTFGPGTATEFTLPNMAGKMPMAVGPSDALGKGSVTAAGQRDSELRAHQHTIPAHGHSIGGESGNDTTNHAHSFSGSGSAGPEDTQHSHGGLVGATVQGGGGGNATMQPGGPYGPYNEGGLGNNSASHSHSISVSGTVGDITVNHKHSVGTLAANNNTVGLNTNDFGAGTTLTDKNLPPYVTFNFIVRLI